MTPTLWPGDLVVVDTSARALPLPGEVVVVRDPGRAGHRLIKRASSRGDHTFAVRSDNPAEALDSRQLGSLSAVDLVGRAMWAWSPRRGLRTFGLDLPRAGAAELGRRS